MTFDTLILAIVGFTIVFIVGMALIFLYVQIVQTIGVPGGVCTFS